MRNSIPSNLYAIVSVVNLKRLRNISYRTTMYIAKSRSNSDLWGMIVKRVKSKGKRVMWIVTFLLSISPQHSILSTLNFTLSTLHYLLYTFKRHDSQGRNRICFLFLSSEATHIPVFHVGLAEG